MYAYICEQKGEDGGSTGLGWTHTTSLSPTDSPLYTNQCSVIPHCLLWHLLGLKLGLPHWLVITRRGLDHTGLLDSLNCRSIWLKRAFGSAYWCGSYWSIFCSCFFSLSHQGHIAVFISLKNPVIIYEIIKPWCQKLLILLWNEKPFKHAVRTPKFPGVTPRKWATTQIRAEQWAQ